MATGGTAVNVVAAPRMLERERLGPLATVAGEGFLVLFLVVNLLGNQLLPLHLLLVPALGVGVLLLVPRAVLMRIPGSLPLLILVSWIAASFLWSADQVVTLRALMLELPSLVVMVLVVGALPAASTRRATVLALTTILVINLLYTAARPALATMTPEGGDLAPGWHGIFGHKNALGWFCMMTMVAYVTLLRRSVAKYVGILTCAVLLVLSQSSTALATSMVLAAAYLWLRQYGRQISPRTRSAFLLTSGVLTAAGVWLMTTSLPSVVGLFGKDLTFTGRNVIWQAAIDAIGRRPWVGYGFGAPWNTPGTPTAEMNRQIGQQAFQSHNGVLEVALHIGVIGFLLYLPVLLGTFRQGLRALPHHTGHGRWVVLSCLAIVIGSFTEPTFLTGAQLDWVALLYTSAAVVVLSAQRAASRRVDGPSRSEAEPLPARR